MKKIVSIAIIITIIAALIVLFVMIKQYNKPHVDVLASIPAYEVKDSNLIKEFEIDEEQANSIYVDKIIQIEGTIREIGIVNGNGVITLGPDGFTKNIICNMAPAENKRVLSLKKGQEITVKGICTGFLLDVVLVKTVIIKQT